MSKFFGEENVARLMLALQDEHLPALQWQDHSCFGHAESIKFCWKRWESGTNAYLEEGSDTLKRDWPFRTVVYMLWENNKLTARVVQRCVREPSETDSWLWSESWAS